MHWNLDAPDLIELAVERGEGVLSAHRALVTETGERTVVRQTTNSSSTATTTEDINWGDVNVSTDLATFTALRAKVVAFLEARDALFVQDLYCGAESTEALPIRVVTHNAWHSAFARNMFVRPDAARLAEHEPEFTVLHAPHFEADPAVDGVNSHVFVIVNYAAKEVIIGGSRYAGEIKKSIFSVMNLILPKKGILPMHCSANTNGENTAIFFGLSGTGKTTLSADPKARPGGRR